MQTRRHRGGGGVNKSDTDEADIDKEVGAEEVKDAEAMDAHKEANTDKKADADETMHMRRTQTRRMQTRWMQTRRRTQQQITQELKIDLSFLPTRHLGAVLHEH